MILSEYLQLYVYEDTIDNGPEFFKCFSILREINPKHLLIIGKETDVLVEYLKDLRDNNFDESQTEVTNSVQTKWDFILLSTKDYSHEVCKAALLDIKISSYDEENNTSNREMYLHSFINFANKMCIRATGAIVKYLDINWKHFYQNKEELVYLHICPTTINNHVLMNMPTFNALQIFNQKSHGSRFKSGMQSASREGISIFQQFSHHCKSKLGVLRLRELLLNPINNLNELDLRLNFIEFIMASSNHELLQTLQSNMQHLHDLKKTMIKIKHLKAEKKDWLILQKTLSRIIIIYECSRPYINDCQIFYDLTNSITLNLKKLESSVNNVLDLSESKYQSKVKFGIDSDLDAKKLQLQDMNKHVTAAARLVAENLPNFLNECAIIHLPEMGHLVTINEWKPNCNPKVMDEFGFKFMFALRGTFHYKNSICLELDDSLGQIDKDIIAHENRILQRLSKFVLKYNDEIRKPLKIIALMDCLISIGIYSMQHNFIRPKLNNENKHQIENGRHPLMETTSNFTENNYVSLVDSKRINIITGPNGSGKSVYLKQVALIIYLAHIGSFVPATKANIGMLHSIFTRIQEIDSASINMSSFMIDVTQTAHTLNNAQSNSLVILDEFGKGTTGNEGLAMLMGILKNYANNIENCPHILISTHFQKLKNFLPDSPLITYSMMNHTATEDKKMLFLYKLVEGISDSYVFDILAQTEDFDANIVKRAKQIFNAMNTNEIIYPLFGNTLEVEDFRNINIPPNDDGNEVSNEQ